MMTSQYPEHDRLAAIEDGIGIGERIDARCTAQTNGQRCIKMVGHVRAHLLEDGTVFEGADVAIYPHIRVTAADLDGVAHQVEQNLADGIAAARQRRDGFRQMQVEADAARAA